MSVILLITFADQNRLPVSSPLATEANYGRYWLPIGQALGLKWFELFQTGILLDQQDLPAVIQEFEALESALLFNPELTQQFRLDDQTLNAMLERLVLALRLLKTHREDVSADFFIG